MPSTTLSIAHIEALTVAVCGSNPITCDLEEVAMRPMITWQDMLGSERHHLALLLADGQNEDYNTAATRIWAASECLKKDGALIHAPLVLVKQSDDGWVLLKSGRFLIATWVADLQKQTRPLVLAVGSYETTLSII
jgi:enediyne polyketide synthase